jgi:hypothetical protein
MYKWRPAYLKEWDFIQRKPPDADYYLYRLDEIYPHIARGDGEWIYWAEGEKDADELARAYHVLATSHHQGAGKATLAQAAWLAKAKHIVLVADLDNAGAHDVIQRNNLLSEAGFSGELDIVRAASGNDAADHVAAGLRLHEFVPADLSRLRAAARQFAADMKGNGNGYTS